MAKLTDEQKTYLIRRFACFASPSTIIEEFKTLWDLEVTPEQVSYYNASLASGEKLADKWKQLFDTERAAYIAGEVDIACFYKRYRLEMLQRMLDEALTAKRKNPVLIQSLLKQAAEEAGNVMTNKREISGPGGKPIEITEATRADAEKELAEWRKQQIVVLQSLRNAPPT